MKQLLLLFIDLTFALCITPSDINRINQIVHKVNKLHTTWKANTNTINSSPLLGAIIDNKQHLPLKPYIPINTQLPEQYDLRVSHPECPSLSEIGDQANCGSCWAFGAASAMSDRICLLSKGKLQTRLSPQHLTTCCALCGDGCYGGLASMAWTYWNLYGIPTGGQYGDKSTCKPYFLPHCDHYHVEGKYGPCGEIVDTPKCDDECQEGYPKSLNEDKTYSSDAYSVENNEEAIMQEIYENGPVQAAFSVYEDFPTYKSGIYQYIEGSFIGGHAVRIWGWGIDDGVKYWWCANSWNDSWGDNGYFKILKGEDECGIESNVVAGTPRLD